MKKKAFLTLPCIAAVAIATFVGKKTFESSAVERNGILLENVEALSVPEIGGGKDGCSTSLTYVNNVIQCPICGGRTGRVGTEYGCKSKGTDSSCQIGFIGSETSCTPYHGMTRNINDVKTFDC